MQFGGVVAVDGVSLAMHEGEILGLVGPNGSGKTTFLNALHGRSWPQSGATRGRSASRSARRRPGASAGSGCCARSRRRRPTTTSPASKTCCCRRRTVSTRACSSSSFLRPLMDRHEHERWARAIERARRGSGLGDLAELPDLAALLRPATAARARARDLRRTEGADARRAVGRASTHPRPTQLAVYLRGLKRRRRRHLLDRPQARLHHLAVRPGRGARARPPRRGGAAATVFADQRVVDAYLGVDEDDYRCWSSQARSVVRRGRSGARHRPRASATARSSR